MEVLKIDNVTLPTPTSMEYKEADLQWDGYRDAAGVMHKTTVRWRVRSIKCKWEQHLDNADITLMRNAINGKEYFTLTYYSDTAGASIRFRTPSRLRQRSGAWRSGRLRTA